MGDKKGLSPFTDVIHAGQAPDPLYGGVSVPIYQSSTFAFASAEQGAARFAGEQGGYIYTRLGNPTTKALEDSVAMLENGCGGLGTSSGMAAVTTVYTTILEKDAHMVGTAAVYGASRTVIEKRILPLRRHGRFRRHLGHRGCPEPPDPADQAALCRDAGQPDAATDGYPGLRGAGQGARACPRRRQYLLLPHPPESPGPGRGHRHPQPDEIHQRAQRRRRRDDRRPGGGPLQAAAEGPSAHGRDHGPPSGLARPARGSRPWP